MARRLSVKELTEIIKKELGPEEDPGKLKVKMQPWHDADLENDVDWLKQLKIKEMFIKNTKKK